MSEEIKLNKKNWLVPFVREVYERFDEDAANERIARWAPLEDDARFNAWRVSALRGRGILTGSLRPLWRSGDGIPEHKEFGEWMFLNTLNHQIEMVLELRLLHNLEVGILADQLDLLQVLAAYVSLPDEIEAFFEISLEDWGPKTSEQTSEETSKENSERREKLAKKLRSPIRALGKKLQNTELFDYDQPLLGLPFHKVMVYAETRSLLEIAHHHFAHGGKLDQRHVEQVLANRVREKTDLIEAVIALAQSDGRITRVERRLLKAIIKIASLPEDETEEIEDTIDNPVDIESIGRRITDPLTQRFIFEQLVVHSLIEDSQDHHEDRLIKHLGDAMGLSEGQRIQYEAEAYSYLENNPGLVEAFSLFSVFRRFKGHFSDRVERLVKSNLSKIVTEVRETGELAQLMAKRATGDLTDEEEERVTTQILDICKTVPSLALLAVPGGSVLLPIIMRVLPFEIMPTAFTEEDEAL